MDILSYCPALPQTVQMDSDTQKSETRTENLGFVFYLKLQINKTFFRANILKLKGKMHHATTRLFSIQDVAQFPGPYLNVSKCMISAMLNVLHRRSFILKHVFRCHSNRLQHESSGFSPSAWKAKNGNSLIAGNIICDSTKSIKVLKSFKHINIKTLKRMPNRHFQ